MTFIRTSLFAFGMVVFGAVIGQATPTNQQLMDCESKCSQRWSFPAPASTILSSTITSKRKATHLPSAASTYTPPPEPTPTHTQQVKPNSSAKEHVAIVTKPSQSSPSATPSPTLAPIPPKPEPVPSVSPGIAAYLEPHNAARAAHGASDLTWSDELAAAAQKWADGCVFKHSGGTLGPYGENLAAGSGDYKAESGVKAWVDEAPEYNSSNPVPSHFTQVVWKGTTHLGCAVASCNLANFNESFWPIKFHVCEYSTAGNVIGQFKQNVQ